MGHKPISSVNSSSIKGWINTFTYTQLRSNHCSLAFHQSMEPQRNEFSFQAKSQVALTGTHVENFRQVAQVTETRVCRQREPAKAVFPWSGDVKTRKRQGTFPLILRASREPSRRNNEFLHHMQIASAGSTFNCRSAVVLVRAPLSGTRHRL